MTMKTCEELPAVLAAFGDEERPASSAVSDHVAVCSDCRAAVAERLLGGRLRMVLDRPLDEVDEYEPLHDEPLHDEPLHDEPLHDEPLHDEPRHHGLDENEAALLLAGFGEPGELPDGLSADDRRRLMRAAVALDEAYSEEASVVEHLGLGPVEADASVEEEVTGADVLPLDVAAAAIPGHLRSAPDKVDDAARASRVSAKRALHPGAVTRPRGQRRRTGGSATSGSGVAVRGAVGHGPSRRRWAFGLVAVAVVAVMAVVIGTKSDGSGSGWLASLGDAGTLVARGATVGMELGLGDRRCTGVLDPAGKAFRSGTAEPCAWKSSTETFTMNVRVEPDAAARYVAVLARDEAGEVSLLYPEPGMASRPLEPTRGRTSAGCLEGLCWLEGGRYDVPAGRLSVVAVFAAEPLPVDEMKREWAPRRWADAERLIERFEVEVAP